MPWAITPNAASGPVWGPMNPILIGAPSANGCVASAGQLVVGTWKRCARRASLLGAAAATPVPRWSPRRLRWSGPRSRPARRGRGRFESLPHEAASDGQDSGSAAVTPSRAH